MTSSASSLAGIKPELDQSHFLNALPDPVLAADEQGTIHYANPAAEAFFGLSAALLYHQGLGHILPFDSTLLSSLPFAIRQGQILREYDVPLSIVKQGSRLVNIKIAPLHDGSGLAVIEIEERTVAQKIERQLNHRGAARSLSGMSAVLAHEIKNPLSGIKGAAQILALAQPQEKELTDLICLETDRIVTLIDSMETFTNGRPGSYEAVNIHQILEHVRKVAEAGFARHVRFIEHYDPSLPPVYGSRDQLIQALLNLVKNAAEATPAQGAEITLSTAYRQGMRISSSEGKGKIHLPLEVAIADNGAGIPDDLRPHLFEPFITTKPSGTGLGLALVAKIIADHGGVVEFENLSRGASFQLRLPIDHNSGHSSANKQITKASS